MIRRGTRNRLTADEMADAIENFSTLVKDYLMLLSVDPEVESSVAQALMDLKLYTPQALFRPDIMQEMMTKVLNAPVLRTFMFNVTFRFMAATGTGTHYLEALCVNLADGLMIDGPDRSINMLPDTIADSMPLAFNDSSETGLGFFTRLFNSMRRERQPRIEQFLRSNPLLISVLMLQFVSHEALS